jgi:hypothetical protein
MACTVACGFVAGCGFNTCAATSVMGKIAIMPRAKIPKIIRIVFVDSFISYLSCLFAHMDERGIQKVPEPSGT